MLFSRDDFAKSSRFREIKPISHFSTTPAVKLHRVIPIPFVIISTVHTNCRECPGRYGRDEGGSGGSGFVSHLISVRI